MRSALLLTLVLAAGCYRDSAPAPHGPVVNTQHPPDRAREADDELAFLPKESELVVGLDMKALRATPAWREQIEPALRASGSITKTQQVCGFDPLNAVTHATFAMRKLEPTNEMALTVATSDAQGMIACGIKEGDASYASRVAGDVTFVTDAQGNRIVAALTPVGRSHLFVFATPQIDAARVHAQVAVGSPLRGSPAFMTIYESLEHGASLWFVVNGASPLFQSLSLGIRPKYVDGTIIVSDHYVLTTRITMDSAADASQLANMLRGMSAQVQQMVEELDIHDENAVLHVDVVMTQAQVHTILVMLGASTGP